MNPEEWELVGVLTKTQGRDGELLLKVKKDFPDPETPQNPVFLCVEREDEGVPFYHTRCKRIGQKHYAVRFELIDEEERASRLLGLNVWLPRSSYPESERSPGLLDRLQGFRIIDRKEGDLGCIDGGIDRPEQPVAFVGAARIPVPLSEGLIERIDEEGGILYTELPEGLTDL
jgi:16S rRNA processing protein RimM